MTTRARETEEAQEPPTSFEFDHERLLLEITEAIYEEMKRKDVNRAELARRLKKNRAWVTRFLSHRGNPTTTSMVEVSRALRLRWRVSLGQKSSAPTLILTQGWRDSMAKGAWSLDKHERIAAPDKLPNAFVA